MIMRWLKKETMQRFLLWEDTRKTGEDLLEDGQRAFSVKRVQAENRLQGAARMAETRS